MSGMEVKDGKAEDKVIASNPLILDSLNKIPQQIRFGGVGIISNVLFLTGHGIFLKMLEPKGFATSTIYAIFYLLYIPVGHLMNCLFVFGWPSNYLPSLLSNYPIGITSMMLGATATGWLAKIDFDSTVFGFIQDNLIFLVGKQELVKEEVQGTYSGIVVLVLTSLWTFVLTSMVMAPPKKKTE